MSTDVASSPAPEEVDAVGSGADEKQSVDDKPQQQQEMVQQQEQEQAIHSMYAGVPTTAATAVSSEPNNTSVESGAIIQQDLTVAVTPEGHSKIPETTVSLDKGEEVVSDLEKSPSESEKKKRESEEDKNVSVRADPEHVGTDSSDDESSYFADPSHLPKPNSGRRYSWSSNASDNNNNHHNLQRAASRESDASLSLSEDSDDDWHQQKRRHHSDSNLNYYYQQQQQQQMLLQPQQQ
jgi:hypothetical protein